MKQVLFMAMLVAGMLLTGCSKDSESKGMETKGNTEQKAQTLTKEQIVGVWRNGDYWVSFSEDGFMSAYLNEKCIAEGDYMIEGDTVKAESSLLYFCTRFVVNDILEKEISLSITYRELMKPYDVDNRKTETFKFRKTDESPCTKNALVNKEFSYKTLVKFKDSTGNVVLKQGTALCQVRNHCDILRLLTTEDSKERSAIREYYVYLPPVMYYHEVETDGLNISEKAICTREILQVSQ